MGKSITKNTIFNVSYKLLNIFFPIITSVYLSRVLGPTYIGKVSYAQNIMSYFLVFASLGIPTYGMREIARASRDKDYINRVFTELFVFNLVSSIICSMIYTVFIFSIGMFRSELKLYLCVGFTLYMNVFNVDWFFSGQEEYIYITIRSANIKVLSILSILLFVKSQDDYLIYAFITSLATTGNYVLNVMNLRKRVRFNFNGFNIKRHVKSVFILLITVLATDLYNQIDVTMLGIWQGEDAVGYYANGIKLIRIVNSITASISATIIPRMCVYHSANEKEHFQDLLNITLKVISLVIFPATIGIMMLNKQVVTVLFGDTFLPTADIIFILAPIIVIIGLSYLLGSVVLTATNNEKYLMVATIVGAVVNIILNRIFIPEVGIKGAAIASVISECIVFVIHIIYSRRFMVVYRDKKHFYTSLFALIIMVIIVLIVKNTIKSELLILLFGTFLGASSYFLSLYLFKNPLVQKEVEGIKNKLLK